MPLAIVAGLGDDIVRMVERPTGGSMCAVHPSVYAIHTCPRCGSFACADCLVVLPDGSQVCRSCESRARQVALPWDRRGELGFWRAYCQTCVAVISKPSLTFGTMPKGGSLGSALGFTALSQAVSFATTLLLYALMMVAMLVFMPNDPSLKGFGSANHGLMALAVFAGFFFYLGLLAFMAVVGQLIGGSLEHLVLRLLGAPGSWTETMRGYSFAMGPSLVGLMPLCGIYVFPIWCIVMRVFAYRHIHDVPWGKAVAGALIPTAALICCVVGVYASMFAFFLSAAKPH
jgi:hypothetical protein